LQEPLCSAGADRGRRAQWLVWEGQVCVLRQLCEKPKMPTFSAGILAEHVSRQGGSG
jgi:hypothetical protein